MTHALLASATALAIALSTTPAAAQVAPADRFLGAPQFGGYYGDRDDRRDRRRGDAAVILDFGRGGDWAYANNRSFEPDSYNDWWHDRPDRAFPRWMQNNQNCERRFWSGGTWRC